MPQGCNTGTNQRGNKHYGVCRTCQVSSPKGTKAEADAWVAAHKAESAS